MDINKPISVHEIAQYLTKKWWLPITLVGCAQVYVILGSIFLASTLGNYPLIILIINFFNGIIYFACLFVMLYTGVYQLNNKRYFLAWFNILLSIIIFLVVSLLGLAIT